jgi:hypothetical protein
MLEGLFILGAAIAVLQWWSLAILVVLFINAIIFSNDKDMGVETFIFAAFGVAVVYTFWDTMSIGGSIAFTIYYLAIGALWSIIMNALITIKAMKKDKYTSHTYQLEHYTGMISIDRSVRWVLYWPFSILNYIIGDFIADIVKKIVSSLGNINKHITTYFYNKIYK